ncbi:MAG: DinB family protein [Gemmatimonadaceae bacterium]|nr:DinB family protein [Gemmatimonadaceae bacterium]
MAAFTDVTNGIPDARWLQPQAPGKWTPAEEVLHVALSYEVALRGMRTGAGMRARVSPMRARLLRWLVLPVIVNSSWFPRAKAPAEIRPPAVAATGHGEFAAHALCARLERVARDVRDELPLASPDLRFRHAYFGDLAPRQALRMLSAHTRHHTRVLARRFPKVAE